MDGRLRAMVPAAGASIGEEGEKLGISVAAVDGGGNGGGGDVPPEP